MAWERQPDEMIVSTGTKAGHVRAEYTGTFVDIFVSDELVDAFRPGMIIESPEQLRRIMRHWIDTHDAKTLLRKARESRKVGA